MRRTLIAAAVGLAALHLGMGDVSGQQPPLILSQLAWFDRAGKQLSTVGPLADHGNLELSPDGMRIAAAVGDRARGTRDIWIYEADGTRHQFTTSDADENWSIWSPDGDRVVLNSFSTGRLALLQRPARGTAQDTDLLTDATGKWPVSWSPDGRQILYVTNSARTGNDIWVLPLGAGRRPYAFSDTDASENWATFSPDGRFVAYSSTEPTGRADVYIAPIPGDGRMWRVSPAGGTQARWRRQGEILYLDPDSRLMSATLQFDGNEIVVTVARPLFTLDYPYPAYHAFDVTSDGARILVNTLVISPGGPRLTVLNQER
jgi:eukaryotic-like serine/threonine-protein kinase